MLNSLILLLGPPIASILERIFGYDILVRWMIIPSLQCMIALYLNGLEVNEESFARYFRDDSEVKIPQTGTYVGFDGITEYARVANPQYSDFFADYVLLPDDLESKVQYVGYSDGLCSLRAAFVTGQILNPATTTGAQISSASLLKIYFDVKNRYFPKLHIYFAPHYFDFYFSQLATDAGRESVCNVLRNSCSGIPNLDSCEADMAALDTVEGEIGYADGDSYGCRALHATMAKLTPELHCAHVSLSTTDTDSEGNKKCSTSATVAPSDMFTDDDIAQFNQECVANGIDPALGYKNLES